MFICALWALIGSISTLAGLTILASRWLNGQVKRGHYASARYDKKSDTWRIIGSYGSIANKLADIRQGRQPGAIKYID